MAPILNLVESRLPPLPSTSFNFNERPILQRSHSFGGYIPHAWGLTHMEAAGNVNLNSSLVAVAQCKSSSQDLARGTSAAAAVGTSACRVDDASACRVTLATSKSRPAGPSQALELEAGETQQSTFKSTASRRKRKNFAANNCGGEIPQRSPAQHSASEQVAASSRQRPSVDDTTTLMIRNLPAGLTQQQLLQELDECGFKGMYDFVYVPRHFSTDTNQGFAFVNLISVGAARKLAGEWRNQYRFNLDDQKLRLNVSAACTQGLEANLLKWACSHTRRIRNPSLRPYVAEEHCEKVFAILGWSRSQVPPRV